jgi:hypothetical protein
MPKQINTALVGTYNDTIFYKWKGVHVMRAKGRTGNQAPVAKQQAAIMGKASAISARLRAAFKPLVADAGSRKVMYRLNNILQQWLRTKPMDSTAPVENIELINGFSFSDNEANGSAFYAAIPVRKFDNGQLFMQIPSFDSPNPISPLPFSGQINIKAIAVSCNIENPADSTSYTAELNIAYDGTPVPAQALPLTLETKPGYVTVVAVSINDMVAGIVRAMYN